MEYAPDTPFYVSGSLQGCISDWKNFRHAEVRPAELRYFSASEDYDLFLRDSYHLMDVKTSTEMADIFVRDNTYSNVHGAIGFNPFMLYFDPATESWKEIALLPIMPNFSWRVEF